jgi:hypothetical protein
MKTVNEYIFFHDEQKKLVKRNIGIIFQNMKIHESEYILKLEMNMITIDITKMDIIKIDMIRND